MLRLILVLGLCLLGMAPPSHAQTGQTWEFCANHGVTNARACFGSIEEAESWMRQDSVTSPRGRKFLERTGLGWSNWNNSLAKEITYAVRPRPGKLTGQEYAKVYEYTSFGGNTDWVCHCDHGVPTCRGGYGDCGPGQCQACPINNGDLSIFKDLLSKDTGLPGSACNVTFTAEQDWPSPPLSAGRLTTYPDGSGATASNIGAYTFANGYGGYDGVFSGFDPRSLYNKTFVRNFGARNSSGVCTGNYREKVLAYRDQVFECEAGLSPIATKLNAQGGYVPAGQVGSMHKVCGSSQVGVIETRVVPTKQCSYENPCVPATGAKVQHEVDFKDGLLGFARSYNSINLALTNYAVGPSWYHQYSERLFAPSSTYVLHVMDDGNVERFDSGAEVAGYYSVNDNGAILRKLASSWELRTADGLLKTFDSAGLLTSVQRLGDASSRLTMLYATVQQMDATLQGNPAGVLDQVVDAKGRSLKFHYGVINPVTGVGANAADPCAASGATSATCSGLRLLAVELPDSNVVTYAYGLNGEPIAVEYPDGTSRMYHYNEPQNICPAELSACAGSPPAGGFPHALTGISEQADGAVSRLATFQFDNKGRAISTSHANGANRLLIGYGVNGSGVETATMLFSSGKKQVLELTPRGGYFRKPSLMVEEADGESVPTLMTYAGATPWIGSSTDGHGNRTNFSYPTLLRTVRTDALTASGATTPQTRTVETSRDQASGQKLEEIIRNVAGELVLTRTWTRNSRGQVLSETQVDGVAGEARTITNSYCEQADVDAGTCPIVGLLVSSNESRTDVADITTYQYYVADHPDCVTSPTTCAWRKGDLWKVTNAAGQVTETLAYDGAGRVLSSKDPNGVITDFEYHPRGWLTARKIRGSN